MPKVALPIPVLTDSQKSIIDANWQMDLRDLVQKVWNDESVTLREVKAKAVRIYLASINRTPATAADYASLTTSQQEFIAASYQDASGPTELTRTLHADPKIQPGDNRVRAVLAYIRKIDPNYRREEELCEEIEYQAPRSITALAGVLNRFGIAQRPDGKALCDGGLTVQETKQLDALLRYMRRPAFKVEAEKFTRRIDREVFEENFLSTCWDKPDLSPEHVLQFITLASVSVQRNQADRMARKLNDRFEASLEDTEKRLSKPEVDALKETAAKQAETVKQMNTLIKTLTGERSKQMSERMAGNSSMHPIVSAWKAKESRERMLALAKKYNDELKGEIGRLAGMDALKAEMFGVDPVSIAL